MSVQETPYYYSVNMTELSTIILLCVIYVTGIITQFEFIFPLDHKQKKWQ
jgi:hypothetical protein